ncbi:hypothetical protein CCHR01_05022 [Colletotrichum chrysophilum]|uniref:Uncharacterized protein n=1 Tax=Colletotrichum chrysophilum TaxID=1836956 RepID=A0AAD9EKZ2_9PEZI|nr:hypothetical protein CCHR01_05022 [Colletotrichum chrysophilum]
MDVVRHTHIFTPPFWPGNQVLAKFPLLLTTSHLSTAAQYGYAPQDIPPVTVSFAQPRKGPPFRCSLVYPRLSIRTPCQAMPGHAMPWGPWGPWLGPSPARPPDPRNHWGHWALLLYSFST